MQDKTEMITKAVEGWISTKEGILSHVRYGMTNRKWSKADLEQMPHKNILDMALIYGLFDEIGGSTIWGLVTWKAMDNSGITMDELDEAARKNTDKITTRSMAEVMAEMYEQMGIPEAQFDESPRQYVIANNSSYRGAIAMAFPGVFEELANKVGCDLVIIPSSIHELLVIPVDDAAMDYEDIRNMIAEVNETQVAPHERLGDRPYYYKKGSMQVSFMEA